MKTPEWYMTQLNIVKQKIGEFYFLYKIFDTIDTFDTIEWLFIFNLLQIFDFGENLLNAIKFCQKNSTSRVEQNGFL